MEKTWCLMNGSGNHLSTEKQINDNHIPKIWPWRSARQTGPRVPHSTKTIPALPFDVHGPPIKECGYNPPTVS